MEPLWVALFLPKINPQEGSHFHFSLPPPLLVNPSCVNPFILSSISFPFHTNLPLSLSLKTSGCCHHLLSPHRPSGTVWINEPFLPGAFRLTAFFLIFTHPLDPNCLTQSFLSSSYSP